MPDIKVIATAEAQNNGEIYKTEMQVQQHTLIADELLEYGGKDSGPSPADFLCMALASCKVITLRMYVERKHWKADSIKIKVTLEKDRTSGTHTFICELFVTGNLNDQQKKRLLEISKACPIQKLLGKTSEVVTLIN